MTQDLSRREKIEIFLPLTKVLMVNAITLFLFMVAGWALLLIVGSTIPLLISLLIITIAYILTWPDNLLSFLFRPHLSTDNTGLHIRNFGVLPHTSYAIDKTISEKLIISFPLQGRRRPSLFATGARRIIYDKKTGTLWMTFVFPDFMPNIGLEKFLLHNLANGQSVRPDAHNPPPIHDDEFTPTTAENKAPPRWQNVLTGSDKPTHFDVGVSIAAIIVLFAVIYTIMNQNFIPSPDAERWGWMLALGLTGWLSLLHLRYFKQQERDNTPTYQARIADMRRRGIRPAFALWTVPVALYVCFYILIVLTLPNIYTDILGNKTQKHIIYESISVSSKRGYCINSLQLGTGLFKDICVSEDVYNSLPETGHLTVLGKESIFGFRVEAYRYVPQDRGE